MVRFDNVMRWIYNVCGVLPIFGFIGMFSYISFARYQLGYWPYYGSQPDPYLFGYAAFYQLTLYVVVWSFILGAGWLFITLVFMIADRGKFSINRVVKYLYIAGVCGLLSLRFLFEGIYLWYFD